VSVEAVSWAAPLVYLAFGLAAGALLSWLLRRRATGGAGSEEEPPPVEVRDLAEREAMLLAQLEDLEDTAGKYRPAERERQRGALEVEAAATLKALEASLATARRRAERSPAQRSGGAPEARPASALRGFLWGAGSVAAIALLLLFASESMSPRQPNGSVTGAIDGEQTQARAADASADEAKLQERIRSHPDDVDARLELTRLQVSKAEWMGVWEQTQSILKLEPDNPEALAFQGLVRFAMGQPQEAIAELQRAEQAGPDLVDPYAILSLVYAKTGHMDEAEATLHRAAERFPDRRPMFAEMLTQLRQQAAAEAAGGGGEGEGPAAVETAAAAPPAAGGAGEAGASDASGGVAGTVELAAEAQGKSPPGAVLFVIARPAGVTAGPPTAVQRLTPTAFPLAFTLDQSSSMLGQPLPARLRLEARLDADGDPLTHSPSDLHAELDDVAAGSTGLRLLLHP
jgi:tetratricopeptide (TPR) repeat protein